MAPGQASPNPRRLLARVRDVMAGAGSAQHRLDETVAVIAEGTAAEVCSVYVMRPGEVLELFATHGLRASAVHLTRLRVGEGLVGEIAAHARPLALADAQGHPSFVFRPETGEEIYHSLMGVPILRGGRVIGVLVVQNRTRRQYLEEEVEALQTVAMVLAELVAGGELVSRDELRPVDGIALLPLRLEGVYVNSGIGIGRAVLHQPRFDIHHLVAEDPELEHRRLSQAFADMHGALDDMLQSSEIARGGEHHDILESYRMIAEDAGLMARIDEAITGGLTAEAAVQKVHNDIRARMSQITDPYLRERIHDLDDLANRLLQHLFGAEGTAAGDDRLDDMILVARSMGPAQLLDYDHSRLRGLVLEEGSATSHVAIVAKAFDIPVVVHAREVLDRVEPGDPIIVDGDNAQVFIRPGEDIRQAFAAGKKARDLRQAAYASLRELPAVTVDGQTVGININAGLLIDVAHLKDSGAAGIGLYRTEIPFMVRADFPDVAAQQRLYTKVLRRADGKPVVFRTLDVGGDKLLPYWDNSEEENPIMGWRAIRVSLDHPAVLRHQLRAMIRAAAGGELRVMFPMLAEVAEFDAARALLEMELDRERERGGRLPGLLEVGAMLEVPALAFQLPALLERVDFLSIGSNDLLQFLFASDRNNVRLAERYDSLSPLFLGFLRSVLEQCRRASVPVSLCGDMASRPLEAMALVGMGLRDISVPPSAVGPLKAMIRSLDSAPLRDCMSRLYGQQRHSVREHLRAFAKDHGVMI